MAIFNTNVRTIVAISTVFVLSVALYFPTYAGMDSDFQSYALFSKQIFQGFNIIVFKLTGHLSMFLWYAFGDDG